MVFNIISENIWLDWINMHVFHWNRVMKQLRLFYKQLFSSLHSFSFLKTAILSTSSQFSTFMIIFGHLSQYETSLTTQNITKSIVLIRQQVYMSILFVLQKISLISHEEKKNNFTFISFWDLKVLIKSQNLKQKRDYWW